MNSAYSIPKIEDCIWDFGKRPKGKRPLGKHRYNWKYNIKMGISEIGWSGNVDACS
jgi:hypothetical protein